MRLVCVGNTIIDVAVSVGDFPDQGGDVLARTGALHAGGAGFNVMCAASRLGVHCVYAGLHGTGPFGDAARAAMLREGIELAHEPVRDRDTGWDIAITDASAERTFITVVGAESSLTTDHLRQVELIEGDAVYVSGYALLAQAHGSSLCEWISSIPAHVIVVFDPGPLAADIPRDALNTVLAHSTWLSANEREATILTGESDLEVAASQLAARVKRTGGGVILRRGAAGCLVAESDQAPTLLRGVDVDAVDTNGAGDAHVGAFIASILTGLTPVAAAQRANAAAAFSVTSAGPATAPTLRELDQFLERER